MQRYNLYITLKSNKVMLFIRTHYYRNISFQVDDLKTQLQSEMDSKANLMTSLRREQQRVIDLEEKLAVYIKEHSKLQESNRVSLTV